MLNIILAHLASVVTGQVVMSLVTAIVALINAAIAGALAIVVSIVLSWAGVPLENIEQLTARTICGFYFISCALGGLSAIVVAIVIFHWFGLKMGWVMVLLLAALPAVNIVRLAIGNPAL